MGILYKSDLDPSKTFTEDEAYSIQLKKMDSRLVTTLHVGHEEAKAMFFDKGYKPRWQQYDVSKKKYVDAN